MADVTNKTSTPSTSTLDSVRSSATGLIGDLKHKTIDLADNIFPPQRRREWHEQLVDFAVSKPELTVSLLSQQSTTLKYVNKQ